METQRRLLLLIIASVPVCLSSAQTTDTLAPSHNMQVYIGTFTGAKSKGIYFASFNEDAGRLGPISLAIEARNPSFLAVHPSRRTLYAVNEISDLGDDHSGTVSSYSIDSSHGKLRFLNQQSSGGAGPCHLAVDPSGRCLLVANYGGGSIASLSIGADGALQAPASIIQHSGSSILQPRQLAPHPHFIAVSADDRHALICDLGLDKMLVYALDPATAAMGKSPTATFSLTPGSGPRHVAFHPNRPFSYVINELSSSLALFTGDLFQGLADEKQTISTLPPDSRIENTAAEVQVHPSGKFVYASNRGRNTLSSFTMDAETGSLRFLHEQPTMGKTPRHFALDPGGRWLLVANQDSDNIVVFGIDTQNGSLTLAGEPVQVPTPSCILFIPQR